MLAPVHRPLVRYALVDTRRQSCARDAPVAHVADARASRRGRVSRPSVLGGFGHSTNPSTLCTEVEKD